MVNPGGSTQPPAVGAGSLSWKRCAGCGGKIGDRFLLYAMDSYWHSRCLKCSCCQAQLGEIGTSCYTKSGMILCRNDYIRLFGNSGACSACGQSIPASELVMRAQGNVYHLKCFTCSTCRNRLVIVFSVEEKCNTAFLFHRVIFWCEVELVVSYTSCD
ncbi:LIM domain transcription factor LMO4b isoform X2 [Engraulis encrasicolus]|uniref:LIM domain transcription factor LMO4b isoform X2 n=1 Tax=Engraulis encrasicolus TaxID=184585 RepID=UPI002FCEB71E